MKPTELPIACELFAHWRRARGNRGELARRPFTRNWEDLLAACEIVSADDRAAAERDIRGLAADGWITLKTVRYRANFLERITLPLEQELRWQEAFGFQPPTEEESRLIRAYAWQPELAFLREERVNLSFEELRKLDAYLANGGRDRDVVPIKERSLEIFGDEKRLDIMEGSTLFHPERLSLEKLRCRVVAEPLGWRRGPSSVLPEFPVLVIENCATWHSFCHWNKTAARYRAVIYGRGNAFIDSVSLVPDLFVELHGVGPIEYFGDLDPAGLRIARRAHGRATQIGLPGVQPAVWCYQALLTQTPSTLSAEGSAVDEADLAWLGGLGETVRGLFLSNHRLAQEHIGSEYLSKLQPFRQDLR